jgi:para-aminobenzoate synthetase component 1
VRIERLGDLGEAPGVLRTIAAGAERCGLAPPAALIGDWFGSAAVIAPSLKAVAVDDVFAVPAGESDGAVGGGWFGYLSYPDAGVDGLGSRIPEAAGGWSDSVLRQDRDGRWWYESLSGAGLPEWLTDALSACVPSREFHIAWGEADRDVHRRGVLDCLEAIAAGSTARQSISSSTPLSAPPPRARRTWQARGVRWRRCRLSCSCDVAERR